MVGSIVSFDMSILASALAGQYGGANQLQGGTATTSNQQLSAKQLAALPPWDSRQPKVQQAAEVRKILAAKSILDPDAAALKKGKVTAETDIKKLFGIHRAMDRLQTLSEAANRNGVSSSERKRLNDRFQKGTLELDNYLRGLKLKNADLIKGVRQDKLETKAFKSAAGVMQGQILPGVTGPTVAVADFANAAPFDMVIATATGETTLNFDFAEMGDTVRSLDNVASYINGKLEDAGFNSRVQSYYYADPLTGQGGWGMKINRATGEDLTFPGAPGSTGPVPGGNLIVNGDFRDNPLDPEAPYGDLGTLNGWTSNNDFELFNVGERGWAIDTDIAYAATPDEQSQSVQTEAGKLYDLTFDYKTAQDSWTPTTDDFDVLWNGNVVGTFSPDGKINWLGGKVQVTGTGGMDTLTFREKGENDAGGSLVANVRLQEAMGPASVSPPPPPPSGPGVGVDVLGGAGNFDNPNLTNAIQRLNSFDGWSATGTGAIVIDGTAQNGIGLDPTGQLLELSGPNQVVSRTVNTSAGQNYRLSLDFSAGDSGVIADAGFEVLWNGQVVGTFNPQDSDWETRQLNVTGTGGADTLAFRSLNTNGSIWDGAWIDNVKLEGNATPTGPNLVANGSFESGTSGWNTSGGVGFVNDATRASDGTRTTTMSSSNNGAGWSLSTNVSGTTAGQAYALEFDYGSFGTVGSGPESGVRAIVKDAGGNVLASQDFYDSTQQITGAGIYQKGRMDFGATGSNVTVEFVDINSGNAITDSMMLDNVSVRAIPAPVSPPPPPAGPAQGTEMLINGSFDNYSNQVVEYGPYSDLYQNVAGWTSTSDANNGLANDAFEVVYTTGSGRSNAIDLDMETVAAPDAISQSVQTQAGRSYDLSFTYETTPTAIANGGNSAGFEVLWNGNVVGTYNPTDTSVQTRSLQVTGTGGQDTLTFREIGSNDGYGAILSDVSLKAGAPLGGNPPPPTNLLAGKGDFANPDLGQNSFTHFTGSAGGWTTTNRIEIQQNITGGAGTGTSDDQYMELDGNISTTVQTQAGQAYNVAFDFMKGNDGAAIDQQFEVVFNGNVVGTFDGNNVNSWQNGSVSVTGTGGTDTLTFRKVNGTTPWEGALIDSVTMTAAGAPSAPTGFAPVGPSTTVNATAAGADNYRTNPTISALSDGGTVVAWQEGSNATQWTGKFQRFDAAGNKVGAETTFGQAGNPEAAISVAGLTGGGFVVGYQTNLGSPTNGWDLQMQRYDANGSALGAATSIPSGSPVGDQITPTITALADGGYAVAWDQRDTAGSGNYDINTRFFNADGTARSNSRATEVDPNDNETGSNVTQLSDGRALVTWTEGGQISGRFYDAQGNNGSTQFTFIPPSSNAGTYWNVDNLAATSDGGFVLSWTDTATSQSYVQKFDSAGAGVGNVIQVAHGGQTGAASSVSVEATSDGGFVMAYKASEAGNTNGIFARTYNAAGQAVGDVARLSTNSNAEAPNLAKQANGDIVAVWQEGGGNDVGTSIKRVNLTAPGAGAGPNLITNGSFEADNVASGTFQYMDAPQGWTAPNAGANEVKDNYNGVSGSSGTQYAELGANAMSQTVSTQAGQAYTFSFDYRDGDTGNPAEHHFQVKVNGTLLEQIDANGATGWTGKSYSFTGTGNDTVTFERVSGGAGTGVLFDNVQVRAQGASPPPPPPPTLGANLVTNGGFEANDIASNSFLYTNVTGWTGITGSQGELQDNSTAPEGQQVMELMNGGTKQSITTTAGKTYQLDFASRAGWDGTAQSHAFEVWYNGSKIADINPVQGQPYQNNTFTFNGAGGPADLEFRMKPGQEGGEGAMIDNVRVRELIPASPPPPPPPVAPGTNIVTNGSFEGTDVASNSSADVTQAGWTTVQAAKAGLVDTLDYSGAPDGSQYAELDNGGGYKTTLNTEAGRSYTLDFDFKNNVNGTVADNEFEVWWNGQKVGDYGPGAGQGWTNSQITVTGTGNPTALEFRTKTNTTGMPNFNGAQIDDVKVIAGPLPGTAPPSADIASRTYGGNLIQDGGFEGITASSLAGSAWETPTGLAEIWRPSTLAMYPGNGSSAPQGTQFIELDRDSQFDSLSQDVTTEAGKTYQLDFNSLGRLNAGVMSNTLEVMWNDEVIGTVTAAADGTWDTSRFDVIGTGGTDRLTFRETVGGNNSLGPFIDNVRLREVTNAPADNPNDGPSVLGLDGQSWGEGGSTRLVDMSSVKAGEKFTIQVDDKKAQTITVTSTMTLRDLNTRLASIVGSAGTAKIVQGVKGAQIALDPKLGRRIEVMADTAGKDALADLGLYEGVARKLGTGKAGTAARSAFVTGLKPGEGGGTAGTAPNGVVRGATGINAKPIAALEYSMDMKIDDKDGAKDAADKLEGMMRRVRLAYKTVNGDLDKLSNQLPAPKFTAREAMLMGQYTQALNRLQGGTPTSSLFGGF